MNQQRRLIKKAAALTVTGTLLLTQSVMPVLAAEDSSKKEEVVYAMLQDEGSVSGIYVVNSFHGGTITDYGSYTDVRNLTTEDEIVTDKDKISISTDAEKLYYQGNLSTKEIPWDVKLTYRLDGKAITAEELAGKSGDLQILLKITQNKTCDESFWKGYALQTTILLNGENCTNIEAEGATIANVGSDKQLSYIIMPQKGADLTIKSTVKDFEMDPININAMRLNLDFSVEQDSLDEKVDQIKDAANNLDDGAGELQDGAKELQDGSEQISDGAGTVNENMKKLTEATGALSAGSRNLYVGSVSVQDGAGTLNQGVASLNAGISTMKTALDTLNENSDSLTSGSSQLTENLKLLQNSLKKVSVDTENLSKLSSASTQIKDGIDGLVQGMQSMNGSIDTFHQALADAGVTSVENFITQNQQAVQALAITDTQRVIYGTYTAGGAEAVSVKLQELAAGGNAEAAALLQQIQQTQDMSLVTNYVTNAGTLIQIETLLNGDIAYIQGSNQLINGIDAALDPDKGALMTGAVSLQKSYRTFDDSIQTMVQSLSTLATDMVTLKQGVDALVTGSESLDQGVVDYTNAVGQIVEGYQSIYSGSVQVANGTSQLYQGTNSLVEGALQLQQGSSSLDEGAKVLEDGTDTLARATTELTDGAEALTDGTKELKSGTRKFKKKTKNIDEEISDTIDETIDNLTGKNEETISFVSEKNTNVDSVLFVLKTPAIQNEEEEAPEKEEETSTSFTTKVKNLFGSK